MKKLFLNTIVLTAVLALSNNLMAQNDAASFVRAGTGEAQKLIGAYLQPLTKGLASGVNDAWYSTGKPLGLLGFDVKVGFGASFVREESKSYTLNSIGMSSDPNSAFLLTPIGGTRDSKQPTLVGEGKGNKLAVSVLDPFGSSQRIYIDTIKAFSGINSPFSLGALPFLQVSLGLVKNTEIMIRVLPIQSNDFTSSGFGFGVKHSIAQWIWGVEKLPIDISGIYTYNRSSLEYAFGDNFLDADRNVPEAKSVSEYKDSQKLAITTSGHQFGLIVSKKLSVFTPYLGLTLNSATSEIAMKGLYPIQSVRKNGIFPEKYNDNISNPITFSNTVNSTRAALGFRIKLLVFAFGAEYNHAFSADQFNTFNAVFSINVQQLAPIPKL